MEQIQVSDSSESLKQHLHACLNDLTCRVQKISERTYDDNVSLRTDESALGLAVSCAPPAQGDTPVTLDPPAAPPCNTSPQGEGCVNEHGVCVTPWNDELRMLRSKYAASGQDEAPVRAADASTEHDMLASIEQDASVHEPIEHDALLSSVREDEVAETALALSPQHSFTSTWLLPTPLLPMPLLLTEECRAESQEAAGWSQAEVIEEAGEMEEEEEAEEEEECLSRAKRLLAFLKGASADA